MASKMILAVLVACLVTVSPWLSLGFPRHLAVPDEVAAQIFGTGCGSASQTGGPGCPNLSIQSCGSNDDIITSCDGEFELNNPSPCGCACTRSCVKPSDCD